MNDKSFMATRKLLNHSLPGSGSCANQIKTISRKLHQKSEKTASFNTNGTISQLTSKMPISTSLSVIFTGYPEWPYTKLKQNVNLPEFYKGSRTAIEVVSQAVSKRNLSVLNLYVEKSCGEEIAAILQGSDFESVLVNQEDIFYQFISDYKIDGEDVQLNLVSYSLKNLKRCKSALKEFKEYNKNLLEGTDKERPILKREDFDAAKFRKISDNFEEMHPGRLLKESDIRISNFTFEKQGSESWKILAIGHLNTKTHWSWFRRLKWKGRIHISIQFDLPIMQVIRYDMIFDTVMMLILIYLQVLAVILARKITEEEKQSHKT